MRKLLRGRDRQRAGVRVSAAAVCLAGVLGAATGTTAGNDEPALRITSPIGRTGLAGTIRIVARLDPAGATDPMVHVRFLVDGEPLATDADGPPYETTWVDANPFERRELVAEADLPSGRRIADTVVLDPLAITDAVQITSVPVETSVLDADGRFVTGLRAADFALSENGEPQALDLVRATTRPALVALVVDSSQSLAIQADAVRDAAVRMVDALGPEDQLLVAPFSRTITSITGPTTDRHTVLQALGGIHYAGGTAIVDSLKAVATSLKGHTRRVAVVLITDGYDEHSESDVEAAIAALRESSATLYVIGVGGVAGISLNGQDLLSTLAAQTGGRAWFPRGRRHLRQVYETIAEDVRNRYLLTYTPRNQRRDGTWRTIDVEVGRPGLRVRARPGYRAPIAPPIRASLELTAIGTGDRPVRLTRDDLAVFEDGVEQQVDTFHEAVLPVTVMLALDGSGSMRRSAEAAQAAAREFVQALRPEDRLGMIGFADAAEFVHLPTTRRDWSLEAIDEYVAEGGTALYDALHDGLAHLEHVDGRRVIVVVTDGRDENAASTGPGSVRTWDDVLQALQQIDVTVYAIGIGSRVDRERLEMLAARSGGAAYFPADATMLGDEYHKIVDELRRRYAIGWTSTNRERNGGWRTVEIRARRPDVTIRSREGYYAPVQ